MVALLMLLGAGWWFFAPTPLGGSTRYVVTNGISMEPRFHTGDLAIVRPAANYRVGEIVAYWSTLLHTVVLHRIIARHGDLYVFKGDNNHFIDPRDPTRSELLGKLWLHIPRGGLLIAWLHNPIVAAGLCGALGLLMLGGGEQRRRRNRRRNGSHVSGRQVISPMHARGHRTAFLAILTVSATAAVAFLALGLIAATRPLHRTRVTSFPYTQQVSFGYSATASGGLYPGGIVETGDPIFLSLVHRFNAEISYRLLATAPHKITGTEGVLLRVTGPTGWSGNFVLAHPVAFTGDHASTRVLIDLPQIEAYFAKVQRLTGIPGGSGYTITVLPQIHIHGTLAGRVVNASDGPSLTFAVESFQLQPGGTTAASQSGAVTRSATVANTFGLGGFAPSIVLLRWLALAGFLIAAAGALLALLVIRSQSLEEGARIQAKYGHLIVPIMATEDLGWPPIDVPSFEDLVRLAESGARLILRARSGVADTYLVNDDHHVYRYQAQPIKVQWGEWNPAVPQAVEG